MSAERIADAAIAWNYARRHALVLKNLRAAEQCENEAGYERETDSPAVPPCWKTYVADYTGDGILLARDQWCEPCKRRQEIHLEYREVVKHRGAALRRLERIATKPSDSTDGDAERLRAP